MSNKDRVAQAMINKRKKPNKYLLKVMDFSAWNGVKFGFGFTIGVAIAFVTMMVAGFLLTLLLNHFFPLPMPV